MLRVAKQPLGSVFIIEQKRDKCSDVCLSVLNVKGQAETLLVVDCLKIG